MFGNFDVTLIWNCANRRWSPQIGDPSLAGWVTVAAYGLCCLLALFLLRRRLKPTERLFWMLISAIMLALAINKQLDLQSLLTATGRCLAQHQGWYDQRRAFQFGFIKILLGATIAILLLGFWLMRKHLRRNGLALLGLGLVAGFVAIRAIGFHHFDAFINSRTYLDLRFNFVLELSGLILIASNALALLSGPRR
jgi:hypothetical protein